MINLDDNRKHVIFMVDPGIAETADISINDFVEKAGNALHQALCFSPILQGKLVFHACIGERRDSLRVQSKTHLLPSAENFFNVVGQNEEAGVIQTGAILAAVEKISETYHLNETHRPIFIFLTDKPLKSLTRRGNIQPYGHSQMNTYAIVSTSAFQKNREMTDQEVKTFLTVLVHEFGHVLGAEKDRNDTRNNLGPHCVCPDCVMQQTDDFSAIAKKRRQDVSPFCENCRESILRHAEHVTGQTKEELLALPMVKPVIVRKIAAGFKGELSLPEMESLLNVSKPR